MATSLSTRNLALVAPCRRPILSRKVALIPRASLKDAGDFIAQGFLKNFVPGDDKLSRDVWKVTGPSFTGKITHHEHARKPFRDGFPGNPHPERLDEDVNSSFEQQGAKGNVKKAGPTEPTA